MTYCVTPGCLHPQNPDNAKFCFSCGASLWLQNRYRPLQPIGRGGFGRTFLGVDEESPSRYRCVIKQLHLQSQNSLVVKKATELFRQEAVRLSELGKHAQIPSLLGYFEQQKRLYLVQEYIQGLTLEQELQRNGAFHEKQIWELLRDLLPILKFIHDRKVLHRDIKPANIMRGRQDGKLVLIDFGVAKLITDSGLFHTGTAVGSVEYMPPEQTRGKALPASDLYSLGVTCIYLLTQVSPLELFDIHDNQWIWRDRLPRGRNVSDRLRRLLDKLLQPAVSQRYKSVGEVLQAVAPTESAPTQLVPPPQSPRFFAHLWRRSTAKKLQGDNLCSEVGVEYTTLQRLVAAGKWQQADAETWNVLCQALGKPSGSYIQSSDLDKLPCQDLQTIDHLWVKYSQGRFGFSVQKQIYDDLEGDYGKFCHQVSWPTHNNFRSYLQFNLLAPIGHLPSRAWASGSHLSRHAATLSAKLNQCQIASYRQ